MKKGIAMVSLVIIILLIAILASVVALSSAPIVKDTKLTNFVTNMSKIENATATYYATRATLPIKSGTEVYDKSELLLTLNEAKRDILSAEITSNGDDTSMFYFLDLSVIGVQEVTEDFSVDSFIVNSEGTHVYYIEGYELNDDIVFSITKDINEKVE